jgi:ABC-2 type transport system permease protein
MLTLVGRSLRRSAGILAALVGLLGAFQIALVATARSFEGRNEFAGLSQIVPAFLQQAFGLALSSFSGMVTLGYFEPLPVMTVVQLAIYLATEPAGDIESGLVDLVLARPLPRQWLITRSLVAMTVCTIALNVTMGAGTWLALWWLAPAGVMWPQPRLLLTLMIHLAAVGWCFGAIGLAAAASARRRGLAQAPVAIGAVAFYLLDVLGESWSALRPLARVSPFHYFHGAAILAGTADSAVDILVLGSTGVVVVAVAYWRFHGRDV